MAKEVVLAQWYRDELKLLRNTGLIEFDEDQVYRIVVSQDMETWKYKVDVCWKNECDQYGYFSINNLTTETAEELILHSPRDWQKSKEA